MIDWDQEILAGPVLIREAMQSNNFVAGAVGWQLKADGDAEIGNATIRGEVIVGDTAAQYIFITPDGDPSPFIETPTIEFHTGNPLESKPGKIYSSGPLASVLHTVIESPVHVSGPIAPASIDLNSDAIGPSTEINFSATFISTNTPIILDTVWTPITLAGTWVDAAGARAQYLKDAAGTVHVRGQISGGAAVTIGNLPAGYRPTQTVQMALRSGAGAGVTSAIAFQTNGDIVVITNLAQSTPLQRLDCSFSTL